MCVNIQVVKNNQLTILIIDAYLYISISLLPVLFLQHLQIYCNRRKVMIIKPECS